MAGQAAHCSREEIRACIRKIEKSTQNTGSSPKLSLKTTSKQ